MRTNTIYNTNNTFARVTRDGFYGRQTMAEIADDIMSDFKFDYRCKRNIELIRDGKKSKSLKETK